MEDTKIIDLYWQRSQSAIHETDRKYGSLCRSIAYSILANREDSEECVEDTYLAAWNSIPPQRPVKLSAYLGRITRNFSFSRIRESLTQKRGNGEAALAYEELEGCVASTCSVERSYEQKELIVEVDAFLSTLSQDDRLMFMYRYWLALPVDEIAGRFGCKSARVTSSLHRSRKKLRAHLIKEGML